MAALAGWLRPRTGAGEIGTLPEPLIEMLPIGPVAGTTRRWLADVAGADLGKAARVLPDLIWRCLAPA